jgi:hypothetical protein
VISLNLVLAGLRLGLKNRQVGEKWVSDDCRSLASLFSVFVVFFIFKKIMIKKFTIAFKNNFVKVLYVP